MVRDKPKRLSKVRGAEEMTEWELTYRPNTAAANLSQVHAKTKLQCFSLIQLKVKTIQGLTTKEFIPITIGRSLLTTITTACIAVHCIGLY